MILCKSKISSPETSTERAVLYFRLTTIYASAYRLCTGLTSTYTYLHNIPITSNLTMSTSYPHTRPVEAQLQPSANYGVFVRQTNGRTNCFLITLLPGTGHAPKAVTARLHLHNRGLPIGRQIAVSRSIYELKIYKRNRPWRSCSGGKKYTFNTI